MLNFPVVQHNARTSVAVWEILSLKRRSAVCALFLMYVLVLPMLAGVSPAFAEKSAAPKNVVQESATLTGPSKSVSQININTADAQTLAAGLKGIGDARAAEIIRHRETYGSFASAEELLEVKGIGEATLEMNRDLITLE